MRWLACRARPEARHPEHLPRRGIELELGERLALGYQFRHCVLPRAGDPRGGAAARREHEMFGEFRLVRALTDEQIAAVRDPRPAGTVRLPRIEDAVKAGGFLAGRRTSSRR
jgi:hypothetical protein